MLCPAPDAAERELVFEDKSGGLVQFSDRIVTTAKLVATGNTTGNKKVGTFITYIIV